MKSRKSRAPVYNWGLFLAVCLAVSTAPLAAAERPNILWLVSEDNGPFLGCYGCDQVKSPHLDGLAAQGVRYENAFSNAPVCAPSRSTLITGAYACSLGTEHMRSGNPIPPEIRFFTEYLREAGYYCSNNAKEDYNTRKPAGAWDESSRQATYRKRGPGQPFFSVFNYGVSHESALHRAKGEPRHDPSRVRVPRYEPDIPAVRRDWAYYFDAIEALDGQIGKKLAELEQDGLADDTIVFYYADHGGVLPRSKRFLFDSGVHVPMIVRFPAKYRHLAPSGPGTTSDRLVSFVDFAPTVLSLAGVPVPAIMQGEPFLGPQARAPRDYVYHFRGRMDERYDMARAVRDRRFKYIRNYYPHLPWGQHLQYLWRARSMQAWAALAAAGDLTGPAARFFEPKAPEELYDLERDPDEVVNLAQDPAYGETLDRLRDACTAWQREIRDAGFLPEQELIDGAAGTTPYARAHDVRQYDLDRLMTVADQACGRSPVTVETLAGLLGDTDSGVRFWAALGLVNRGRQAASARGALASALADPVADVRVTAAEALCGLGAENRALPVLVAALKLDNMASLRAANVLDRLDDRARPVLAEIKALQPRLKNNYVQRCVGTLLADLAAPHG